MKKKKTNPKFFLLAAILAVLLIQCTSAQFPKGKFYEASPLECWEEIEFLDTAFFHEGACIEGYYYGYGRYSFNRSESLLILTYQKHPNHPETHYELEKIKDKSNYVFNIMALVEYDSSALYGVTVLTNDGKKGVILNDTTPTAFIFTKSDSVESLIFRFIGFDEKVIPVKSLPTGEYKLIVYMEVNSHGYYENRTDSIYVYYYDENELQIKYLPFDEHIHRYIREDKYDKSFDLLQGRKEKRDSVEMIK